MPFTDINYTYTPEDGHKLFHSLLKEKNLQFLDKQDNPAIKILANQQGQTFDNSPFFFLEPLILADKEASRNSLGSLVSSLENRGLFSSLQNNNYQILFRFKGANNNPELCHIIKNGANIQINFLKPFDRTEILDKSEKDILELLQNVLQSEIRIQKPSSAFSRVIKTNITT